MLTSFTEPIDDTDKYKKRVIDCFVSSVYYYEDKLIVKYNITDTENELKTSKLELLEKEFEQMSEWWSLGDSNPWPLHCERSALPTELRPHDHNLLYTSRLKMQVQIFPHKAPIMCR